MRLALAFALLSMAAWGILHRSATGTELPRGASAAQSSAREARAQTPAAEGSVAEVVRLDRDTGSYPREKHAEPGPPPAPGSSTGHPPLAQDRDAVPGAALTMPAQDYEASADRNARAPSTGTPPPGQEDLSAPSASRPGTSTASPPLEGSATTPSPSSLPPLGSR